MSARSVLAVLLLLLGACATPDKAKTAQSCNLVIVATLPATVTPNRQILIPIGINGHNVMMQIDTGASQSVMYAGAVSALGLKPRIVPNAKMIGVNGETAMYYVEMAGFTLGENIHPDKSFRVAVIGQKQWGGTDHSIGLMGGDYLRHFDVEFDLEHHVVNLFMHHPCEGQAAYWPHDLLLTANFAFGTFPNSSMSDSDITIPIEINGKVGKAILDSGASITAMTWHSAGQFGITRDTEGVKEGGALHGIGDRAVDSFKYRIPSIKFGDEIISNVPTKIYRPVTEFATPQMLFGVDFLLKNRVYVAYEEKRIYFTPYHYRLAPVADAASAQ